jgi:hypothetical protein
MRYASRAFSKGRSVSIQSTQPNNVQPAPDDSREPDAPVDEGFRPPAARRRPAKVKPSTGTRELDGPADTSFDPAARGPCATCFGHLDPRSEVEFASALRADTPTQVQGYH